MDAEPSPAEPSMVALERDKSRRIVRFIRRVDARFRRKLPLLAHQDAIGLAITLGASTGMLLVAGLYIGGVIPAWACVVANAMLASLLHEIEHDLIHNLYFKDDRRTQNTLFWIVWLFRLNTINPWFRKAIHLLHHKHSGHLEDIEERFIGNGMPFGIKRILTMIDPLLAIKIQGPQILRDARAEFRNIRAPLRVWHFNELFRFLWYSFLLCGLVSLVHAALGSPLHVPRVVSVAHRALDTLAVVYLLPSWLRQTSIQIVSSNMHYFGDVDGLFKQTQVLDSWLVLPLHLFCFNFGATHGIHHFVVNQPFYLRQAAAPYVLPALKKHGVRFNDFASMLRANRYFP